jgi:hypothetical protein
VIALGLPRFRHHRQLDKGDPKIAMRQHAEEGCRKRDLQAPRTQVRRLRFWLARHIGAPRLLAALFAAIMAAGAPRVSPLVPSAAAVLAPLHADRLRIGLGDCHRARNGCCRDGRHLPQ